MPRDDWADFTESLDAFWAETPDVASMGIEDRELWHAFAAKAEQHETARLINANRGSHRDAFGRPVVRP